MTWELTDLKFDKLDFLANEREHAAARQALGCCTIF